MTVRSSPQRLIPAAAMAALVLSTLSLCGCAGMGDTVSTAFADPAKYDLYSCKQLEAERKSLANHSAELQGLMAKADTGVAGPLVAELAYRNEYISVRGQSKFAEQAWQRDKCHESPPGTVSAAAPPAKPEGNRPRKNSLGAIY